MGSFFLTSNRSKRSIVVDLKHPQGRSVVLRLCGRADVFLQLRPGTDDALALAMLNVLIAEELWDKAFVERWTSQPVTIGGVSITPGQWVAADQDGVVVTGRRIS